MKRKKSKRWRFMTRKDNPSNFEGRTVFIGRTATQDDQLDEDKQIHFTNNAIKSSKYTILTFLPR